MGNCFGSSDAKTREIDQHLREGKGKDAEIIKLLFLGAGGSGKSTLFKQLRLLHGQGLQEPERKLYTPNVKANITTGLSILARQIWDPDEGYEADEKDSEIVKMAKEINNLNRNDVGTENKDFLLKFWNHQDVKDVWDQRNELQIQDSLAYFMLEENLNRICETDYIPSIRDCLNVRARTTGIVEENFLISNRQFLIVDVGGQRSERKKWIKCFEGVTGIIFVVALSGYDETLFEDEQTNRLQESLKVFEDLNRKSFNILQDASLIIFLNKWDLFDDKIKNGTQLSTCFPDFQGPEKDPEAGFNFVKRKFLEKNNEQSRKVYVHKTCATNTDQMRIIFDVVNHTIINRALVKAGLLVA